MIAFAGADQRVAGPDCAFTDQRLNREEPAEQLECVETEACGLVLGQECAQSELRGQRRQMTRRCRL